MSISWSAILAAALAPVVIRWSLNLANKRSADGKHFRPAPTLRALYPGGLIMTGWAAAFCIREIIRPSGPEAGGYEAGSPFPYLGAALSLFFLGTTIVSWPSTVVVEDEGLSFRRLFRPRRMIRWEEIDDTAISMDGRLVIYTRPGKQFEVSAYNEGRYELKDLVQQRLHHLHPA
jgi:hypothetical protein